jgi:hypothetical protein
VLRGAAGLLASAHPALFFEFSPRHLLAVGETPSSIFPFLLAHGYQHALVYNLTGAEIAPLDLGDERRIEELIRHAQRRRSYFDLLTFHASRNDDFVEFRKGELNLSSRPKVGSFPASWAKQL